MVHDVKIGLQAAIYRAELDGLRALAVIAVIINHFNRELLPSGFLGVDIFFVISGYVITSSLLNNVHTSLGSFLLAFYVRRIKRLVPALVFFVAVSSLFIALLNPTPNESLRTGISALFGISNLRLLNASADYFANSTELNGFTHTWSLGVEEQFYLLFPVLVWYLAQGSRNETFPKLIITVASISVVSLIGYILISKVNQSAAYYLMPTRLWELGAGSLTFLLEKQSNIVAKKMRVVPPFLAAGAIVLILFLPSELQIPATIAVVCCTSVLVATLRSETRTYRFFTQEWMVQLGLMSYSLYLWHWGVLSLSRLTTGVSGHWIPFQVALIFALAFASFRFVETPFRTAVWRKRPKLALALGLSAPLLATVFLIGLTGPLSGKLFLGRLLNVPVPSNLEKTWWVDRKTGEYIETCHVEYAFTNELLRKCLAVQPGKNGKIYLVGDSFARNYLPTVRSLFQNHVVAYLTMGGGCAFLPQALAAQSPERRCHEYSINSSDYILAHIRPGDLVVIGQRITKERTSSEYFEFIKSFARKVGEKGVPTVLLDGTVPPKYRPEECISFAWIHSEREGCFIHLNAVVNEFSEFDFLANKAAAEVSSLYYAPLRTGLCKGSICGQNTASGTAIWHDAGHITENSAAELAPLLLSQLLKTSFFEKYSFAGVR